MLGTNRVVGAEREAPRGGGEHFAGAVGHVAEAAQRAPPSDPEAIGLRRPVKMPGF